MVQTLVRAIAVAAAAATAATTATSRHLTISLLIPKRLFLTSKLANPPSIPSLMLGRRSLAPPTHDVRFPTATTRYTPICCGVKSCSKFGRPPEEMELILQGWDYWWIVMEKPGVECDPIDYYAETLVKVVGVSLEVAKKKIYKVYYGWSSGFFCKIDELTARKFEGLPGVLGTFPDPDMADD
ncbi:multiple organellar RNA editing factor 6, mitochondrial isoform X1 [Pyrus x bretschneideri]|uniref:multiple organellar RNA editing factor 6, mitochondrial isoform X1 n=1 Tax=Pyrus x bretschneideri TaxID=225117 RepID=UPI00202EAC91|nr:multiple organellar RNA editing factor 6, mitochondrial isoform X1 [Pyrus x bretschneideri]